MKLEGRRESSNVQDRRGSTVAKAGGIGLGGIVLFGLIYLLTGRAPDPSLLQQMGQNTEVSSQQQREFTEEEQALAKFSSQVLASTEDIWTKVFQQMGRTYTPPTMVLYTDAVQTACGQGTASVGPFYCSGDQCLYIDLSFFSTMRQQLGIKNKGDLDFAYAYVIAHEVGHHVEYLLGILDTAHQQMSRLNETQANKVSVRLELLADYYAGVWGHYENATFQSIDDNDLQEAIETAKVIGDNYLQERARGYSSPESFTHGTSAQRMKWLKRGLQTGDMSISTFNVDESQL